MPQIRFDPTFKDLVEPYPRQWVDYLAQRFQLPRSRKVNVINADVSTVSAAADKVIRVGGRRPWLLHLEAEASHDARLGRNLLLWNVLLNDRHDLPVCTVVLLLRPEADRVSVTGQTQLLWPGEHP